MHMLYARIRKHDGKCSLATVLNLTSVCILWLNLPSPFLSPGSNSIQNRGMRGGKGQQLQQFTTLQALHLCSRPRNIITQLCSTLYNIYLFINRDLQLVLITNCSKVLLQWISIPSIQGKLYSAIQCTCTSTASCNRSQC